MGKKSRKTKKSGAAASSESAGLPAVVMHDVTNTHCAICGDNVDLFHWSGGSFMLLNCCGRFLCKQCAEQNLKENQDETDRLENLMLNDDNGKDTPFVLPTLQEISRPACRLCGTSMPASNVEYRSRFRRLAEAGHVHAQFRLGVMHRCASYGLRKDLKAATKWISKAAKGGHISACASMGEMHYFGHGVAQSYEQARLWFERAHGHAEALHGLGTLYREGKVVEKDQARAVELYHQAAVQDYPDALADYGGALFEAGRLKEALVQFEKGASMEQHLLHHRGQIAHCQFFLL